MTVKEQHKKEVSIATLHEDLEHIRYQMDEEYQFGLDPETGVLTLEALRAIRHLENRERQLQEKIKELETRQHPKKPMPTIHKEEIESFDLVRVMEQYEKEREEQVLKEIQEARERGRDIKTHEISR